MIRQPWSGGIQLCVRLLDTTVNTDTGRCSEMCVEIFCMEWLKSVLQGLANLLNERRKKDTYKNINQVPVPEGTPLTNSPTPRPQTEASHQVWNHRALNMMTVISKWHQKWMCYIHEHENLPPIKKKKRILPSCLQPISGIKHHSQSILVVWTAKYIIFFPEAANHSCFLRFRRFQLIEKKIAKSWGSSLLSPFLPHALSFPLRKIY